MTSSDLHDLVVIGGGPSGASAAITAAQLGFRVLLLESGTFPRHKVCGEFVSGEAFSILERLLGSAETFGTAPRISTTRIFVDDHVAELPVSPKALSVARYDLDLLLWQRAKDVGVRTQHRTTVKAVDREGDTFLITHDGGQYRARSVIDATGRWSKLRAAKPANAGNWIGLKGHFYESDGTQSCDLYFFRGGYCGIQPLGDGKLNAAAMVNANVARGLRDVFSQNRELELRSAKWRSASEPVSTAPLFFLPPHTSDREMALVGDAAAFIDPFAGDGISMALHSGKMAAMALAKYLRGKCLLSDALAGYDQHYRELIAPAQTNAARLRRLLRLPKPLQITTVSLLRFPIIARAAVQQTRVRKVS